jgi:hypothetical protein
METRTSCGLTVDVNGTLEDNLRTSVAGPLEVCVQARIVRGGSC